MWNDAAGLIREGKSEAEVLAHFRTMIAPDSEETADGRRQRTKEKAGSGAPTPASTSDGDLQYTGNADKDLKQLESLGINY